LGRGAVYTVESMVAAPTANELRHATGASLPANQAERYLQLPHPYPQAQALAESATTGASTTYDKVEALISWIGAHTRYSTNIPPLPPGVDTVNAFLFGSRVGYCEQISTALAVMLRTLDIPVREVVGYVPGPYNPVTDLYTIRADDAHAWVQVWFPGYGWQSFDPTAAVPLANPDPGTTALHDVTGALGRIPVWPATAVVVVVGLGAALIAWRRSRPATWAERVARDVERAGRRAGRPRRSSETLVEYAAALDGLAGEESVACQRLAAEVEASVYGGREPADEARRRMMTMARQMRIRRRQRTEAAASSAAPP
jgi:transglutaminase-like putative cysteine protease